MVGSWLDAEVQERTFEQSSEASNCTGRSGGAVLPRTCCVEPLSQVKVIGVPPQELPGTTKMFVYTVAPERRARIVAFPKFYPSDSKMLRGPLVFVVVKQAGAGPFVLSVKVKR